MGKEMNVSTTWRRPIQTITLATEFCAYFFFLPLYQSTLSSFPRRWDSAGEE